MKLTIKSTDVIPLVEAVVALAYVASEHGYDEQEFAFKKVFTSLMCLLELDEEEIEATIVKGIELSTLAEGILSAKGATVQ